MTRICQFFLGAVIIITIITAGCTSVSGTNPPATVTPQETAAVTTVPPTTIPGGSVPAGTAGTQAPGTCTANINSDPANCGGCGYACPANAVCQQAQCFCNEGYTAENNQCVAAPAVTGSGNGCPDGMSPCPDGYCYELGFSTENCGACGNICPSGMVCSSSVCTPTEPATTPVTSVTTTPVTSATTASTGTLTTLGTLGMSRACLLRGTTNCNDSCVNLTSNESNCGTCGHVCKSLAPNCCGGACVDLMTDSSNCGTCGHTCAALSTCKLGSCKSIVVVRTTIPVKIVPSFKVIDQRIPIGP